MADFNPLLAAAITRDNALELLATVTCPHCGVVGQYDLTPVNPNNGSVSIVCTACGEINPFHRDYRLLYVPVGNKKRRANDIATVIKERGAYCYICGVTFEQLRAHNIGAVVHHVLPFATNGETGPKIPVCTECHELANFMQRLRTRMFKEG